MSWGEVFKINSNMSKPLNTLISELISGVTTLLNTVNTNVTNTKTQVGTVNTTVNTINTTTGTINTNVGKINTTVTSVNTAVGNVSTKVDKVNTQVQGMKCLPMRVITSTTTYTPEKTGTYKVVCVGKGGNSSVNTSSNNYGAASGGGGGVAIKTLTLDSSQSYNVTVSSTASFGTLLTATSGGSGSAPDSAGSGGTASGGDYNFTGSAGSSTGSRDNMMMGGSVTANLTELSRSLNTSVHIYDESFYMWYGDSILKYGGGAPGVLHIYTDSSGTTVREGGSLSGLPAAVIIIPIE